MLRIAITGNIACGKSKVESFIANIYPVYDADKLAHETLEELTEFFGYDVFTNGVVDRKKLGELVFSDSELRKKLEEIIHPKIKQKILEIFEKHKNDKLVFVSVPLLYEAGFENLFDKVILITTNPDIQLERLMSRNNYTKEEALKRINSQLPQDEKIKKADYVISNDSTVEELEKKIINCINQLIK